MVAAAVHRRSTHSTRALVIAVHSTRRSSTVVVLMCVRHSLGAFSGRGDMCPRVGVRIPTAHILQYIRCYDTCIYVLCRHAS